MEKSDIHTSTRIRVRTRRPRFTTRLATWLGLALALSHTAASARDRSSLSPRRDPRATPPWSTPSGYPPPRPLGPAARSYDTHPAIHGTGRSGRVRLFPRAGERELAMAAHPAGKGIRAREDRQPCRPGTVEIRKGDTLWDIAAARVVGDEKVADLWPRIYAANRDVIGDNPDLIRPGQVLELPDVCGR